MALTLPNRQPEPGVRDPVLHASPNVQHAMNYRTDIAHYTTHIAFSLFFTMLVNTQIAL
jgi:hypothetical protein